MAARVIAGRGEERPHLFGPPRHELAEVGGQGVQFASGDAPAGAAGRLALEQPADLQHLAHVTRLEPLETGGYLARTARGHTVEVSRQSARELRRMLGLRRGAEDESGA